MITRSAKFFNTFHQRTGVVKQYNIPATPHFKLVWQPPHQPHDFRRPCYTRPSSNSKRPNPTHPPPPIKKLNGFTRFAKVTLNGSGGSGPSDSPGQLRACEF